MNNDTNYGVNGLTLTKLDFLLHENNTGFYGPVFEEDGKYFVTTIKEGIDPVSIPEKLSSNAGDAN